MINEWKFLRLCSYFNKMVLYFMIFSWLGDVGSLDFYLCVVADLLSE